MNNNIDTKKQIATTSNLLDKLKPQMMRALPKHLDADRMVRVALTELRKTPKLAQCESNSFCAAIMMCAQLGLEPGLLGHAYLIPYGRQCQFIIGYKGMIDLARRSGQIVSICSRVVYSNDTFELEYRLQDTLKHIPARGDRGTIEIFYAKAELKDGGYQLEVMTKEEVDLIRARSKCGNSGPWVTDYTEMARKTVIRRLFKYLPISIELSRAVVLDEQAERGEQNNIIELEDGIDFMPNDEEVNKDTGEVKEEEAKETSQADYLASKLGA